MTYYQFAFVFFALLNHSHGSLFQIKSSYGQYPSGGEPKIEDDVHFVPLTDTMKQKFVDAHNLARSQVDPPSADMQIVQWDDDIAEIAEKIAGKCEFKHSRASERWLPEYPFGLGENIFVGVAKYHADKPEFMTHKWDVERNYYNYYDLSCVKGKQCGHYTQIVWSSTTKIGCAIAICPKGITYVPFKILDTLTFCHYGPPGNRNHENPYKVGEPCTACPPEAEYCDEKYNMCSPSQVNE